MAVHSRSMCCHRPCMGPLSDSAPRPSPTSWGPAARSHPKLAAVGKATGESRKGNAGSSTPIKGKGTSADAGRIKRTTVKGKPSLSQHAARSAPVAQHYLPEQRWRAFQIVVGAAIDPGKDEMGVSESLRLAIERKLGCRQSLPAGSIQVVRKSFDSRPVVKGVSAPKKWCYVVDIVANAVAAAGVKPGTLVESKGIFELVTADTLAPPFAPHHPAVPLSPQSVKHDAPGSAGGSSGEQGSISTSQQQGSTGGGGMGQEGVVVPSARAAHPVVIIGSGPAGLFAALAAASAGLPVVVIERGQPVEQRGRDIGALLVRGILNPDSNLCYGEGGAGTWSDGKLATKIGRNSDPVRTVLRALVQFGAPESILVAGKPHLGTERLVLILKTLRHHLQGVLGAKILFGTAVEELVIEHGQVTGVKLRGTGEVIHASAVVLAVGHSARAMYSTLVRQGVQLTPKGFAMGFRVEHPQELINGGRYGHEDAELVQRGKGPIPVADYKLNVEVEDHTSPSYQTGSTPRNRTPRSFNDRSTYSRSREPMSRTASQEAGVGVQGPGQPAAVDSNGSISSSGSSSGSSSDPSARSGSQEMSGSEVQGSRRTALVEEYGGSGGRDVPEGMRGVFSFCMCPGGQIVSTSTSTDELCLNGMSFSRRNSVWANSALVVNVRPSDWEHHVAEHGVLAGVAMQRDIEQEAARRGGGRLVAPVQRVVDFLAGSVSTGDLPTSSYRLGVKSAPLHDIYPSFVAASLQTALARFERTIPGFSSSPQALLHGVETRTSAPIRVDRHADTLESVSLRGLYPAGEGAGYAGGIVSAAVDGLKIGEAIVRHLIPTAGAVTSL